MALPYPVSNDPYAAGWLGAQSRNAVDDNDPSIPDPLYWAMAMGWEPIRACMEGTQYLRRNADRYLPQQPRELEDAWRGRINRSVFSLVLRKPVFLEGGDEAYFEEWRTDVDRQGTDLDSFCRQVLINSMAYGHQSWLVDFPDTSNIRTLKDQVEAQLKPYFVPVEIQSVIGWRQDPRIKAGALQQVRIRETAAVPKGRFAVEYKNRVRVLEPKKWELYEAAGELGTNQWTLIENGRITLEQIPLVTTYANKEGTLFSTPLFADIAQLNLTHYQRRADLIQALHVAAQPIMVMAGWDQNDDTVGLSVNNAIATGPRGECEIYYVEPATSSFESQRAELEALVEEMSGLGIAILSKQKNAAESGLAKALDRTDSNAILSVVSKDLEQALQAAIEMAAEYAGVQAPTVVIDRDYNVDPLDGTGITAVNTIFTSGLIDQRTALLMLQRGELFGDDIEVDDVMEAAEEAEMLKMERELERQEGQMELASQYDQPTAKKPED
jgi:Domain of unknown function (DUF4055)